MPAPVSKTAPALPPKILLFRGAVDAGTKVDAKAGTMSGVSLVTANLQPGGWPMWVDEKTLQTFDAAFRAIGAAKSYLRHDDCGEDRTGEEIGLWSGYRIDGLQFRGDFAALDAFRAHDVATFDKLFELAAKAPGAFGVSPVFSYGLVWVRQNGDEIATAVCSYRWDDTCEDYLPCFDPSAPADAMNALPSLRVMQVFSADFVDRPATNKGLFCARPVDAAAKGVAGPNASNLSPQASSTMSLHKQLFAKFRSTPAQLVRATELHEGDEKLSFDNIVATVERESVTAELAHFRETIKTKDGEIAAFREAIKAKDGEIATFRETIKAKDAEIAARDNTIAQFRKNGSAAVPTGAIGGEEGGAQGEMPLAQFNKLSPAAKMDFSKKGGRLTE